MQDVERRYGFPRIAGRSQVPDVNGPRVPGRSGSAEELSGLHVPEAAGFPGAEGTPVPNGRTDSLYAAATTPLVSGQFSDHPPSHAVTCDDVDQGSDR